MRRGATALAFVVVACWGQKSAAPPGGMSLTPAAKSAAPTPSTCLQADAGAEETSEAAAPPGEAQPEPPREVALGRAHSCALFDGKVWCWGDNRYGQLGDGTTTSRARPVHVALPGRASHIAAGDDHVCVTFEGGEAHVEPDGGVAYRDGFDRVPRCWGKNDRGQLGGAKAATVHVPAPASDVSGDFALGRVEPVASAGSTCFEDHAEYESQCRCYGEHAGLDFYVLYAGAPCRRGVPCPMWVEAVSMRKRTLCFLAHGFGGNLSLTCTPDLAPRPSEEAVHLEPTAAAVGDGFACALLENGDVACWGKNTHGEVGTKPTMRREPTETVPGIHLVKSICAGEHFVCALAEHRPDRLPKNPDLYCWGSLGDRDVAPANGYLGMLDEPRHLACGARHACAIAAAGEVTCWGENESGQLGDSLRKRRWTLDGAEPIRLTE